MEEFECSGLWWFPQDEGARRAGRLSFTRSDGLRLSLIGPAESISPPARVQRYPLILGITDKGERITLTDCMDAGRSIAMFEVQTQHFRPRVGYIGAHFDRPEEMRFHKVALEYSYLSDWVCASGFEWSVGSPDIEMTFRPPQARRAKIAQGELTIGFGFGTSGDWLTTLQIRQSVLIELDKTKERPFREWQSHVTYPLQNLMTLATGRPNAVTGLYLQSSGKTVPRATGEKIEVPIRVVYHPVYAELRGRERLLPNDMVFTFQDVEDRWADAIQRWLCVSEELRSVFDLFFSTEYQPEMYLDQRFLNVSFAVETYHRQRIRNAALPEDAHKTREEAILEKCPEEYKDWLRKRLRYSNEPDFKDRIVETVERWKEIMLPLIGNVAGYAQKVADTRNFLVHHDSRLRKKAARRRELFRSLTALRFLMRACLLDEIGLPRERIIGVIQRNREYAFVRID